MSRKSNKYIPALKFHWLTRFYDPLMKLMKEDTFKRRLMEQASLMPNQRILDLACGTGTFALMLKEAQPQATVMGLDADPHVLSRAREKAKRLQLAVSFQEGWSFELPYPDNHFDHVFSILFFHHLTMEMKHKTLEEVSRVLKPGGDLYIMDFDRPSNLRMRAAFLFVQILDGWETTSAHAKGVLLEVLQANAFADAREISQVNSIVGTTRAYHAKKSYRHIKNT